MQNEDRRAPAAASATARLFDDPTRQFWFVGASWDEGDQLERFVKEGIWQNGYDDKFSDEVKAMRPSDRIAIKASFVQKNNLPFDAKGKNVSCMRIKATGAITENLGDGKTVRVAWNPAKEPRDWFFFTYRNTISRADPDNDHARRLILFTFAGIPQDYQLWLNIPYFARKYGTEASDNIAYADDDDEAEIAATVSEAPTYTVDHVIEDGCFLPREMIKGAVERLKDKKNLILQGPPGTGKTWLAKRLAYVLVGSKDRKLTRARVRTVQFHPSLSYEDFVRGWRPSEGGKLALVDGIFMKAVQAAAGEPDLPFVLVIEEINRGNPAQVFGEMLTLLEDTKRRKDDELQLAYSRDDQERIFVPPNLHVIGTMNIADRSLALVDLALRRRFAYVTLEPQLGLAWRDWCKAKGGLTDEVISFIEQRMAELNDQILNDRSLGAQYRIGHSYVTPVEGQTIRDGMVWFKQVIRSEIMPLLEEYWFDAHDKAKEMGNRLLAGLP